MEEEIPWQTVHKVRGKKNSAIPTSQAIPLVNIYHVLMDPRNTATNRDNVGTTNSKTPPAIFIYGVANLPETRKRINEFIDEEHYTTESLANNTIKLLCQNPDTYRNLVKYRKGKKRNPPLTNLKKKDFTA
jgi:hypothetical protein